MLFRPTTAQAAVIARAKSTVGRSRKLKRGLYDKDQKTLRDFLELRGGVNPVDGAVDTGQNVEHMPPYLGDKDFRVEQGSKSFHIVSYGCQMNVSDSEIVRSVLTGVGYEETNAENEANILLLNTCAIREKAESKIWSKLKELRYLNQKRKKTARQTVGVLGCMAERLRDDLLEKEQVVDLVVGPDSYRDLPLLLTAIGANGTESSQSLPCGGSAAAINVQLSVDETYGDIKPIRDGHSTVSAFTSIQRGCNNRCAFCIVPFTRGLERSRDLESIVAEVEDLSREGYKEVTLLGQNVNTWKPTKGKGTRFAELLEAVALVDPAIRVRFTSPHPKDYSDDVLHCIAQYPNICRGLHVPVQSGSSRMLSVMGRGHTRDEYFSLIQRMREIVPNVRLSTDTISGFCGESEEDHRDTLDLLEQVKFEQAFMFAYSMREKTRAHRQLVDDVPQDIKLRRLQEVVETFRRVALDTSLERDVLDACGDPVLHKVLVEGVSKRSTEDAVQLTGKNDGFKRCVFDSVPLPDGSLVQPGDYVLVKCETPAVSTLQTELIRRA